MRIPGAWLMLVAVLCVASYASAQIVHSQYFFLHPGDVVNNVPLNMCADVVGYFAVPGAKIQIGACKPKDTENQEFVFTAVSKTTVSISPQFPKANQCWQGGAQGSAVTHQPCNQATSQQWLTVAQGKASYILQNAATNLCAGVDSNQAWSEVVMLPCTPATGGVVWVAGQRVVPPAVGKDPEVAVTPIVPPVLPPVIPEPVAGTINHAFYQLHPNNGGAEFQALRGKDCMDVMGYSYAAGADAQTGGCKDLVGVDATENNQVFLISAAQGYATIAAQHSKMCLTVTNAKEGAIVEQAACDTPAPPQQQWRLTSVGVNRYLIGSLAIDSCMGIAGNAQELWAKVVLEPCTAAVGGNVWSLTQTALVGGATVPVYEGPATAAPKPVAPQPEAAPAKEGIFGQAAAPGNLRVVGTLVNGVLQGRLEIFYAGAWGTICDDFFSNNNFAASVACRQLGYAEGTPIAEFGGGAGPIHMDDVVCGPTGDRLETCAFGDATNGVWSDYMKAWGVNNCSHDEDVGVVCFN